MSVDLNYYDAIAGNRVDQIAEKAAPYIQHATKEVFNFASLVGHQISEVVSPQMSYLGEKIVTVTLDNPEVAAIAWVVALLALGTGLGLLVVKAFDKCFANSPDQKNHFSNLPPLEDFKQIRKKRAEQEQTVKTPQFKNDKNSGKVHGVNYQYKKK